MALDDYVGSEVAIAVAVTAAALSPRVRGILRTGAVYGLTGVLTATDAVGSFARGVGRGAQQAATTAAATGAATTGATASSPDEAADQLSAAAQGETESTPGPSRRGARARGGQTDA